ncbi:MAG TPA: Ig domain-containing protein [Aldersonia sp.]
MFTFDSVDLLTFHSAYFDGGIEVEPVLGDNSRYDLNGDGFTGGTHEMKFDLNRWASVQFGQSYYGSASNYAVAALGLGNPALFAEESVTDAEIVCYYVFTDLFTGDIHAHSAPIIDLCGITSLALPPLYLRRPIDEEFSLPRVQGPIEWSVSEGSLPDGLALISSDSTATIAGTPTALGPFHFTITARDAATGGEHRREYYSPVHPGYEAWVGEVSETNDADGGEANALLAADGLPSCTQGPESCHVSRVENYRLHLKQRDGEPPVSLGPDGRAGAWLDMYVYDNFMDRDGDGTDLSCRRKTSIHAFDLT